ncbi:MAG: hypothetical protein IJ324_09315 [Lachnospiraceae bacterium]|nr:hypothetical protein [Lachnospiraceae bacterium]
MANVKVHLREIIKYVLLLGLGIQVVLGAIGLALWLRNAESVGTIVRAVACMVVCGGIGYIFLRLWNREGSRCLYIWGTLGTLAMPNVLHTCLSADKHSGVLVLFCFILIGVLWLKERYSSGKMQLSVFLITLLAVLGVCGLSGEQASLATQMVSRFCYPQLNGDILNIPEDLLDEVGYLETREAVRVADGIETILYPSLLERYKDKDIANSVCYELATYGLLNYTKSNVTNMIWDVAGYNFPLLVSTLQLQGLGYDAVTGHNYGTLTKHMGEYTFFYWGYSVVFYCMASVLSILTAILYGIDYREADIRILLLLEAAVLCLVLQGAGLFDYKNLAFVQFLWMGYVLRCLKKTENKDE